MEKKKLLQELCENLEKELNMKEGKQTHTVNLISGMKPNSYWLPQIHIGTTKTISDTERMAWFVEIWVDDKCIFRESHIPHETEQLEIVEAFLITRILRHTFTFGVMESKKFIDEHGEQF